VGPPSGGLWWTQGDRRELAEARRDLATCSPTYPKLCCWVEDSLEQTLTFHRLRASTTSIMPVTNLLERLIGEIKRRTGGAGRRGGLAVGPPQRVSYSAAQASATISRVASLSRADRSSRLACLPSIRSCRSPRHGSSRSPGFLGSFPGASHLSKPRSRAEFGGRLGQYIAAGLSWNKRISAVLAEVAAKPGRPLAIVGPAAWRMKGGGLRGIRERSSPRVAPPAKRTSASLKPGRQRGRTGVA
jgi:Transposase, Mutator family